MVKNLPGNLPMRETQVRSWGREDSLEKVMATHSSVLAWRIPWTEETGRLQSMWLQRVGHDLVTKPPSTNILYLAKSYFIICNKVWHTYWDCIYYRCICTSDNVMIFAFNHHIYFKRKKLMCLSRYLQFLLLFLHSRCPKLSSGVFPLLPKELYLLIALLSEQVCGQ